MAPASKAYAKARQAGQADGWAYAPPPITGMRLTIAGLSDGDYTALVRTQNRRMAG